MLPSLRVKQEVATLDCVPRQLPHFRKNLIEEQIPLLAMLDRFIEVTLEFLVRYLIPLLVLPVLLRVLLNRVIGQVYKEIGVSLEAEQRRSSPDVALRVPVSLGNPIEAS
jgi:hypothetical protein